MKLINNIIYKALGLFFCLSFLASDVSATHIVGGDMTYECLGNEKYLITLTVRRDCDLGSPFAPFDNPASIGFFDSSGDLDFNIGIAGQILIPFVQDDTLDFQINSDCGFIGSPICVHEATYSKVVTLPSKPGGYIAAYQRCCRNGSLNNILDPLNTGSTYFVEIKEEALNVCNSSPVFNQWPDIYICANQNLSFSHSATDADGDQLVYSLCEPHLGATFDLPKPQPPNGPTYDNVTYQSPYTYLDPMGGTALTINPSTGQLSANPNLVGQYLVGICVEEYRDGVLLSRVVRDFEYNVRVCSDPLVASFDVDPVTCGTTEVSFENTSELADTYNWSFDYPNTDPAFSSNATSPTFNYPAYGTYIVQLEAIRTTDGCSDIFLDTIQVVETTVEADFNANFYSCDNDVYVLELEDLTSVSMGMSSMLSWSWTIVQNGQTYTETGNTVSLSLNSGDDVTVTLQVALTNGCMAMLTEVVTSELVTPDIDVLATLVSCSGNDYTYNLIVDNLDPSLQNVSWEIDNNGSTVSLSGNPVMYTTSTYSITGSLHVMTANCMQSDDFAINTMDILPSATIEYVVNGCNAQGLLDVGLSANLTNTDPQTISAIQWTITNGTVLNLTGNTQNITVDPSIPGEVVLELTLNNGCVFSDVLALDEMNPFDISYTDSLTLCKGDQMTLDIPESPGTTILWDNNSVLQNPLDQFSQVIAIPADYTGNEIILSFTMMDSNGCSQDFDVVISIATHITLMATHTDIDCETYEACFMNISDMITPVEWTFADDDGQVLGTSLDLEPCFTFPGIGEYHITISGLNDACPGIPFVYCVTFSDPTIEIEDYQSSITLCEGESFMLQADTSLENDSIVWCDISGTTELVLGMGPVLNITPEDGQSIVAKISEIKGCVEYSESVTFQIEDLDLGNYGDLSVCPGDSFTLDLFSGNTATFSWGPSDFIVDGSDTPTPSISIPAGTMTGTYVLNFNVSGNGCSESNILNINVIDEPLLSFDYEITDCENYTVCFQNTSSIATSFVWDFGDTSSTTDISTDNNPCYSYGAEGTYNVSLMLASGYCTGSSIITPINIADPIVEILNLDIDGNYAYCSNEEVEVSASANTTGTISWFDANGAMIGQGGSIMIIPVEGLELSASITSENGCVSDLATTTFVNAALDLDLFQPITLCRGDSRDLVVLTNQNVTFEWAPHPLLIDGLDTGTPTVSIPPDHVLGSVVFSFSASNDMGCSGNYTYELIIIENEPLSFTYEVTDCENYTVCFTNTSAMSGILIWNFGDPTTTDDVSPEDAPCYTYPGAGAYEVILNTVTGNCTGIPDTMTVTLNDIPDIQILNLPDTVAFCNDNVITVSATSSLMNSTIEWCDGNGTVIGSGPSIDITPTEGLTITAKVTDDNDCTFASDPVIFEMGDLELDYESPLTICEGDTVTLDIQPQNGITFAWNSSPHIISGGDTGNPVVYIDPSNDLDTITLGFVATNGAGCGGQFLYILDVLHNIEPTFEFIVTDCENYTVCFEDTTLDSPGGVWDFGDPTTTNDVSNLSDPCYTYPGPGEYEVTYELDELSCPVVTGRDTIRLNEMPFLALDSLSIDQTACTGDTIVLSATANIDYPINWCLSDGTPLGTGETLEVIVETDLEIIAKVTDQNGCIDSTEVINIDHYDFDLTINPIDAFCGLDTMDISITNNNPEANLSYLWSPEDCILSGGDTSNPTVVTDESKDLNVLVTDIDTGCDTLIVIPITAHEIDIFVTNDYELILGQSGDVEVFNTNPGDDISWSNGSSEIEQNVTPTETTTYVVTVTDLNGCTATDEVTITVIIPRCDDEAVFIPNAFSPNGDGNNDILYVRGLFIESMECVIYDRWGEEIFKTVDQRIGWDGTFKGEPLSPDSYAYCIKAVCINGEENIRTGNVSLLR